MTDLQDFGRLVGEALASDDEDTLRSAFGQIARERDTRVAAAATDADVAHVEQLAALNRRLADEVSRLREDRTVARVAAAKALPPVELLPDTRRKRPTRSFAPRHYVRSR
jgi:hypothetical protein